MATKVKLDRRNTNFSLQLFEYFKSLPLNKGVKSEYDFLKYYQNIAREFVVGVDIDARGLLIQHEMGMGKSILAIALAMDLMRERQPIILLTKSLQENMRSSILKYVKLRGAVEPTYHFALMSEADLSSWIDANFSFVSMNASNMLKQMNNAAEGAVAEEFDVVMEKKFGEILRLSSLDNKLLIVDEAHNLFRAITNGSKNAIGLYEMVMRSKNLKCMFLTGTPIANDPFELVPCFNMLGSKTGKLTLPEHYFDFRKLFVSEDKHDIKNRGKFQNRIFGLVSYVTHHSTIGKALGINIRVGTEFPEELPTIVEKVPMDTDQFVMYGLARDREKDEGSKYGPGGNAEPASMTKPKSKAASSYRVHSRQLSNFCAPEGYRNEKDSTRIPPEYCTSPKYRAILANIDKFPKQLGIVYSQFVGAGGLGTFSRFLEHEGWERYTLPVTGGGIDDFINNLNNINVEPSTWWLEDAEYEGGIELAGDNEEEEKATSPRKFAIISGEVNVEDRARLQEAFNSFDNRYGGHTFDLILLSSTGAEGLDLKNVRHIHVMEPFWNWGRILQIIARGVRNDSHIMLPAEEKNVQPIIYLGVPPADRGEVEATTDMELYTESIEGQVIINAFNDAIHEVSIECLINDGKCRKCSPTNEPLYTDDIHRDIRAVDPCRQVEEKQVEATLIEIDGKKFYYVENAKALYDYDIFEYDSSIDGYRPMKQSNPLFVKIIDEIKAAAA